MDLRYLGREKTLNHAIQFEKHRLEREVWSCLSTEVVASSQARNRDNSSSPLHSGLVGCSLNKIPTTPSPSQGQASSRNSRSSNPNTTTTTMTSIARSLRPAASRLLASSRSSQPCRACPFAARAFSASRAGRLNLSHYHAPISYKHHACISYHTNTD